MSVYETNITNPKKQLEFYKDLSEQLQKENQVLKKQLEYLRSGEYLNQLKFERNMLQDVVDKMEVSKEDKDFIDMIHRNTELLEENKKYKEVIDKLNTNWKELEKYIDNSKLILNNPNILQFYLIQKEILKEVK